MKGLGISFVDNEPKELMYISFYKISVLYSVVSLLFIIS
jgi:hypothetical protein